MSAWKARTLSFVGKVTLTKSILSALLMYTMQSKSMPRAVCDKLDQTCWNFILGDTESTKKVHWVARKDLCKPKEKGEYWTAFGEAC